MIFLLIVPMFNFIVLQDNHVAASPSYKKIKIAYQIYDDRPYSYHVSPYILANYFPTTPFSDRSLSDDYAATGNYSLIIQYSYSDIATTEQNLLDTSVPVIISGWYLYPFAKALGNNDTKYDLTSDGSTLQLICSDNALLPSEIRGKTFTVPSGITLTVWAKTNATILMEVKNTTSGVTYPLLVVGVVNGRKVAVFTHQGWSNIAATVGDIPFQKLMLNLAYYLQDLPFNMSFPVYKGKYPLRLTLVRIDDFSTAYSLENYTELFDYMANRSVKFYIAVMSQRINLSSLVVQLVREYRDEGKLEIAITVNIGNRGYETAKSMIEGNLTFCKENKLHSLPETDTVLSFVFDTVMSNTTHAIILKELGFVYHQSSLTDDSTDLNGTEPYYPLIITPAVTGTYDYVSVSTIRRYLNQTQTYMETGGELWAILKNSTTFSDWKSIIDLIVQRNMTTVFPTEFYGIYHQAISYMNNSTYIEYTNTTDSVTIIPHGNTIYGFIVRLDGVFTTDDTPYIWYYDDDGDNQEETYALIFGKSTFTQGKGNEYSQPLEKLIYQTVVAKTPNGYKTQEGLKLQLQLSQTTLLKSFSFIDQRLSVTLNAPTGTVSEMVIYTAGYGKPTTIYVNGREFPKPFYDKSDFDAFSYTAWYYDPDTGLLYVKVKHESPAAVVVSWETTQAGGVTVPPTESGQEEGIIETPIGGKLNLGWAATIAAMLLLISVPVILIVESGGKKRGRRRKRRR